MNFSTKVIQKKKEYQLFLKERRIFSVKFIYKPEDKIKFWVFKPYISYVKSYRSESLKDGFQKINELIEKWKTERKQLLKPKKKKSRLKRTETYLVEEILPKIGLGRKIKLGKDKVGSSSVRLRTFKDNLQCVACGVIGSFFAKEKHKSDSKYHLNLYALVDGKEILMTHDHIVPKSKGGSNDISNSQTMCCVCNGKKGSLIIENPKDICNPEFWEEIKQVA
jgi:5-methylcytosine-specific restriction endonuclease McrA